MADANVVKMPTQTASAQQQQAYAQQQAIIAGPKVVLTRGTEISPEAVVYVWNGYLAEGKFHLLGGPPGTGKTTLALAIAAAISTGGFLPSGERAPKRSVAIWSGEDDPKDTLIPRLIAAGADLSRIVFISGVTDGREARPFDPAQDVPLLMERIAELEDLGLLILDPVVSAVSGDSNKNAETRRALQPVVDLAIAKRCAVLGITHLSKNTAGRDPIERITGSIAFAAVARVVLIAARVKDEAAGTSWRILVRGKSNIGPDDGGFKYDLEQVTLPSHPGIEASRVRWGERIDGSARELLAQAEVSETPEDRDERQNIADFLKAELGDDGQSHNAGEIIKAAEAQGFSRSSIQRATIRLGVVKEHDKDFAGGWKWRLPKVSPAAQGVEDASLSQPAPSASWEPEAAPSGDVEAF